MENGALAAELRKLRKGRGLTLGALETCPLLLEMFGDAAATREQLVSALDTMGNDRKVTALRVAYGLHSAFELGESHAFLQNRREDYALSVSRHTDTIEAWENDVIDELARTLTTTMKYAKPQAVIRVLVEADGTVSLVKLNGQFLEFAKKSHTHRMWHQANTSAPITFHVAFKELSSLDAVIAQEYKNVGYLALKNPLGSVILYIDGDRPGGAWSDDQCHLTFSEVTAGHIYGIAWAGSD